MECCIEYNYLRTVCGDYLLAGSQSKCVGVVVNGSQLCQTVDLVDYLIGNESCLAEYLSALHDSVAYCLDLAHGVDDLALAGGKDLDQLFKSLCMCGEAAVLVNLSAVSSLVGDVTVDTDSVTVALCKNAFVVHVQELVFKRGAACVNY